MQNLLIKEDLYKDEIHLKLYNGFSLKIYPQKIKDIYTLNNEHLLLNLNAIISKLNKEDDLYNQALIRYQKEFEVLADQATEENISQFLGSNQEYSFMVTDLKRYKEKELYLYNLYVNSNKYNEKFNEVWKDKFAWCDKAIETATAAYWLVSHFSNDYHFNNDRCISLMEEI